MKNIKLLTFAILIILAASSAFALGITPSRKIIEFKDDLKEDVVFNVINNELKEFDAHIYARGELAKYISIEKDIVHIQADQKETQIRYKIDVPYSARKPGVNMVEIVVEEAASGSSSETVVIGKIAIVHQLLLKSPYIGTYASAVFTANNPGDNEDLQFTYTFFNEGTNKIKGFTAELEVYNEELELQGIMNYEFNALAPGMHSKETRAFSYNLPPGSYTAKTRIFYEDKILMKETSFTVGGAYVEIREIKAGNFKLGSINQLDFYLYSRFFKEIKNVFAEIIVKDSNDKVYSIFKTVSADLPPFSGAEVAGYWDTKGIPVGLYKMQAKVKYSGRESQEEFNVTVLQNEIISSKIKVSGRFVVGDTKLKDPIISTLTLAFIILMIINVLLVIYIRRNKRPPEQIITYIVLTNTIIFNLIF